MQCPFMVKTSKIFESLGHPRKWCTINRASNQVHYRLSSSTFSLFMSSEPRSKPFAQPHLAQLHLSICQLSHCHFSSNQIQIYTQIINLNSFCIIQIGCQGTVISFMEIRCFAAEMGDHQLEVISENKSRVDMN